MVPKRKSLKKKKNVIGEKSFKRLALYKFGNFFGQLNDLGKLELGTKMQLGFYSKVQLPSNDMIFSHFCIFNEKF